jgi:hypothetical protein
MVRPMYQGQDSYSTRNTHRRRPVQDECCQIFGQIHQNLRLDGRKTL